MPEVQVFKREEALLPEFLPDKLVHRAEEISSIAYAIKPALRGMKPSSLMITGDPGVGKTTCVKHVLQELSEGTQKAKPIYINCWQHSSKQAVLSKIGEELGEAMPRRGVSADEVYERVLEVISKRKVIPIVALDECDQLFREGEEKVLYNLSRAGELREGAAIGLLLVSNRRDLLARLDARTKSSLLISPLEFQKYSPIEMKEILSERARVAFFDCPKEVIAVSAAIAMKKGGDVRVGLNCLLQAGRSAERRNKVVSVQDLPRENAGESAGKHSLDSGKEELLSPGEKRVLNALRELSKNSSEVKSGELYALLAKGGYGERAARDSVSSLEARGLLEVREERGRGLTRVMTLKRV
jgi:cell division control protein 6